MSLASVGWVTFFGCTVVSTVIRAKSPFFSAPLSRASQALLKQHLQPVADPLAPVREPRALVREAVPEELLAR